MNSLIPTGVSSLLCVTVVIFSYFFFYLENKKKFFAILTAAWSLYVLRLIFLFLSLIVSLTRYDYFLSLLGQLINLINSILILKGTYYFLDKKFSNRWIICCAFASLYLIILPTANISIPLAWLSLPASVFAGWIHIWNGIFYPLNKKEKTKSTIIVSASFILWGIHTIHYSIVLYFLPSFMSCFFSIDVSLVMIISLGMLFDYFHDVQNKLNSSEEKYNLLMDNSEEAIVFARDGIIISFNARAEDISGYEKDELSGKSFVSILHPEDRDEAMERHFRRQKGENPPKYNAFRILHKSGKVKWLKSNAAVFDMDGKKTTLNILRDITDIKKAEEELNESKRRLLTLMSNLPGMAYRCKNNPDRTMEFVSNGSIALTGYKPEEIINNHKLSYAGIIHPEDQKRMWSHIQCALSENKSFELVYRIICAAGNEKWVWEKGQMVLEENNIVALEGFISDITEHKKIETALMQSLIKFEKTFQANPVWVTLNTLDEGRFIEVNEAFLRDTEYRQEEVIGKTWTELGTWVDSEKREIIISQLKKTGRIHNMEVQRKNKYGEIIDTLFSAEILTLEDREVIISVTQNITVLKQIQDDRDYLNEQLLHSQKMESIGRLAGGVAHDFNNMLTVIIGNTEILLMRLKSDSANNKVLHEILNAAERSANVTRQLLAFARKQTISPRVLDMNETLDGMLKMLKRLIGEDIELIWNPGEDLWSVKMDPAQIDQILVNLCVNARDAIEYVGKITINTGNVVLDEAFSEKHTGVKPGEYVLIEFRDNGKGIDKDIMENIFEPFFTTKAVGKGTGLGLSTVYGIVKQNNGFIDVNSAPHEGTTFSVYIPRHDLSNEKKDKEQSTGVIDSSGETILVVEDDASVRQVTEIMLTGLGYNIFSTGNPNEALEIAGLHSGEIHLLLSDVIMPEMSGREMAKKIKNICPDIKVLFMSGYTSDTTLHDGLLYQGFNFVEKPFSTEKLGSKVREILSQK